MLNLTCCVNVYGGCFQQIFQVLFKFKLRASFNDNLFELAPFITKCCYKDKAKEEEEGDRLNSLSNMRL